MAFAPCPPRKRRLPAPQSTPRCALEGGIPTGKAPHPALRGNGRAQRAAHDNMGSGRFPANATSQGFALGRGCFIAYCPRSGGCEARTAMRKKANPFPRKKAHGQDRRKAASGCFGQRLGLAQAPGQGRGRCRDMPLLGFAKPAAEPAAQGAAQARNAKIATIRQNQRQFSLPAPAAQAARGHLRPGKRPCPQVCFPVSQVFSSLWRFVGFAGRPGRWP